MLRTKSKSFAGFFALMVASTCLGASEPYPRQPSKKLHSPRGEEVFTSTAMVPVVVPKSYGITWEYPLPLPRPTVKFVIETKSSLDEPWQLLATVDSPPFTINSTEPIQFFRVGSQRP